MASDGTLKLFVGQIPRTWTEDHVRSLFMPYAKPFNVNIIKDKDSGESAGCAFATFVGSEVPGAQQAMAALNGRFSPSPGRWIQIRDANAGKKLTNPVRLYCAHLGPTTTEDDLGGYFHQMGEVMSISVQKDELGNSKCSAIVAMAREEDAARAILFLNNLVLFPGSNYQMTVTRARDTRKQSRPQGNLPTQTFASTAGQFGTSMPLPLASATTVPGQIFHSPLSPMATGGYAYFPFGAVTGMQQVSTNVTFAGYHTAAETTPMYSVQQLPPQMVYSSGLQVQVKHEEEEKTELSPRGSNNDNICEKQRGPIAPAPFLAPLATSPPPPQLVSTGSLQDVHQQQFYLQPQLTPSASLVDVYQQQQFQFHPQLSSAGSMVDVYQQQFVSPQDVHSQQHLYHPQHQLQPQPMMFYQVAYPPPAATPLASPHHPQQPILNLTPKQSTSSMTTAKGIRVPAAIHGPPGANLFVKGFPKTWSSDDLQIQFQHVGEILSCTIFIDSYSGKSRGFGFVSFAEPAPAEEAIQKMHGMWLQDELGRHILDERGSPCRLHVEHKRDKKGGYERTSSDISIVSTAKFVDDDDALDDAEDAAERTLGSVLQDVQIGNMPQGRDIVKAETVDVSPIEGGETKPNH